MRIKIQDLTDAQANEFCARAQGWEIVEDSDENSWWADESPKGGWVCWKEHYTPTTNPAQAFELIDPYQIALEPAQFHNGKVIEWLADLGVDGVEYYGRGPAPARAIVNAVISAYYGDCVDVED